MLAGKEDYLGNKFWATAAEHATYLFNNTPIKSLNGKTPNSLWDIKPPDLIEFPMHPFGTRVVGHTPLALQSALSGRGFDGIFVGVAHQHRAAIEVFDTKTKRVKTRHTYKSLGTTRDNPVYVVETSQSSDNTDSTPQHHIQKGGPTPMTSVNEPTINQPHTEFTYTALKPHNCPRIYQQYLKHVNNTFTDTTTKQKFLITGVFRARSDTTSTVVFRFYDTDLYTNKPVDIDDFEHEQCSDVLQEPLYKFSPHVSLSQRNVNRAATARHISKYFGIDEKAMSRKQAEAHPQSVNLLRAWDEEVRGQDAEHMNTWKEFTGDPKTIPKGRLISSRAIFSIIYNPDGTFKKFKARLVARGDMLVSKDKDNYAGTVRSDSQRLLFALCAQHDLDMTTLDAKQAFLHARLPVGDEPIYMRRPTGCTDAEMPPIVELIGALYGLDKASKLFEEHFSNSILSLGFKRCISDPQIFTKRTTTITNNVDTEHFIIISTHVDDAFLASTKGSGLIEDTRDRLGKIYQLTENTNPGMHLGLVITRDRENKSLKTSQPEYARDMIKSFDISPTGPFPLTPMAETYLTNMSNYTNTPLHDTLQTQFMSKVGKLIHLATQTRPDILYATTQLSRRNKKASRRDMLAVDRVLRYVAGTIDEGQTYCCYDLPAELYATIDVSYNCHTDSKSHTGITLHYGRFSSPTATLSKKQPIVADSSTSAEYIGTHAGTKLIMWARNLLEELGFPQHGPTILYQDNISTMRIINHKGNAGRMRHIGLRYNFVREQVQLGNITVCYLSTDMMTADALTKPLGPIPFCRHRTRLLNTTRPSDDEIHLFWTPSRTI